AHPASNITLSSHAMLDSPPSSSACLVSPLRSTAQGASGVPRVLTPLLLSCLMLISTRLFATDWPQWHGPTRECNLPKAEPVPTSDRQGKRLKSRTPVIPIVVFY